MVAKNIYINRYARTIGITLLVIFVLARIAGAVENVEIRGTVHGAVNGLDETAPFYWTPQTFPGFYYDLKADIGMEKMAVLYLGNRDIPSDSCTGNGPGGTGPCMVYNTTKVKQAFKVIANLPYLRIDQYPTGQYDIVGWQGEKYVGVNSKANKLSKLLIEQGNSSFDKKTLVAGEIWDMGEGYTLTAQSIDASSSPKRVTLVLKKDGNELNNSAVTPGSLYTYSENNLANESLVTLFVTYVDTIFTSETTKMVQLRFTWLISRSIREINTGDVYGQLQVTTANTDTIEARNKDRTITLSQGSTVDVMGPFKFQVADSDSIRFYPKVNNTTPGLYEVRGTVHGTVGGKIETVPFYWTPQTFPGFYYDLNNDIGTEKMVILTISGRDIPSDMCSYGGGWGTDPCLVYNTTKATQAFKVIENYPYLRIDQYPTGQYDIVGWQGETYVAVKSKANKLSKLLIEQGNESSDNKTLAAGETWYMGEGYSLMAQAIDTNSSPKQVWLVFSKDGNKLDDRVAAQGEVYTYVEKSLAGESDVPLLVTYVDSIYTGATSGLVRLRYTWLISRSVKEIKTGDIYGQLEVRTANYNVIEAKNKDKTITLTQGGTVDVMGSIKFKVADSADIRFYPVIESSPQSQPFDTLSFKPKAWNLVSVPKALNNSATDIAFVNLNPDANNIIWYYNTSTSAWEHPSNILPLRSYWVYNNASMLVTQKLEYKPAEGPNVPPSMTLKAGWNQIGHSSTETVSVSNALSSIDGKYSHLLTYDPIDGWKTYIAGTDALQEFTVLEPGRGYWIFMTQDATYAAVDV